MQALAPSFLTLIESLVEHTESTRAPGADTERRKRRHIVMALAAIASLSNQQFNIVQGIISYYLFASRAPKRLMSIFNHLGVSSSYNSLQTALQSNAKALTTILKKLCSRNVAFQLNLDNLNLANNVRDQRVTHAGSFSSATAAFLLIPVNPPPMFSRDAVNYQAARNLTVRHFFPSPEEEKNLLFAFQSMLFDTVKEFSKARNLELPNIKFPMPSIFPLDPKATPEILTLPLYDLNESKIDEMIKILYNIAEDVGLSKEQVLEKMILFKGDYLTVRNVRSYSFPGCILMYRKAKFRQRFCSPHSTLNYIETATGLFHLEMNVLVMIFRAHLGKQSDLCVRLIDGSIS
jgi:hypothetical protein